MLGWFQALMPREDKFFTLFEKHAAVIVEGARHLRAALDGGPDLATNCERVAERERAADAIARDVIREVRRTFITPFDRADIQELIGLMDDSIDQMRRTTKAIDLFEIREFDDSMRAMGDLIVKAAEDSADLVGALRQLRTDPAKIARLVAEIDRVESESDRLCDQGVKALYLKHRGGDAMAYIAGAEIYEHIESVVDRFEDIANRINGILIEHI